MAVAGVEEHAHETLQSLQFANRARNVKVKPKVRGNEACLSTQHPLQCLLQFPQACIRSPHTSQGMLAWQQSMRQYSACIFLPHLQVNEHVDTKPVQESSQAERDMFHHQEMIAAMARKEVEMSAAMQVGCFVVSVSLNLTSGGVAWFVYDA